MSGYEVTNHRWNKALWLAVASHVPSFNQSECFISESIAPDVTRYLPTPFGSLYLLTSLLWNDVKVKNILCCYFIRYSLCFSVQFNLFRIQKCFYFLNFDCRKKDEKGQKIFRCQHSLIDDEQKKYLKNHLESAILLYSNFRLLFFLNFITILDTQSL